MANVRFYLASSVATSGQLDSLAGTLLGKVLGAGHKVVVCCADEKRLEQLNDNLWLHGAEPFLPHGGPSDPAPDLQPVYLTTGAENPNGADVLLRLSAAEGGDIESYALVLELFAGHEAERNAARARWQQFKDTGHNLEYYLHEGGRWQRKA